MHGGALQHGSVPVWSAIRAAADAVQGEEEMMLGKVTVRLSDEQGGAVQLGCDNVWSPVCTSRGGEMLSKEAHLRSLRRAQGNAWPLHLSNAVLLYGVQYSLCCC